MLKYATKAKYLTRRVILLLAMVNAYDKLCICNGCRPSWLTKVISKTLDEILSPFFDLIFIDACSVHDILYRIGGTESDRKRADKYFKYLMNLALKNHVFFIKRKYKKLEKTKWYQIRWKNIKRGLNNTLAATSNVLNNSSAFLKRQYLSLKVYQYYLLVRKFGKSSFNYKSPMDNVKQFPSYQPVNKTIEKNNKLFRYEGRLELEKEHESRIAYDRR